MPNKPVALIQAPVDTYSGYGQNSRDIVEMFLRYDKFDVKVVGMPWGTTPKGFLNKGNPKHKRIIDKLCSPNDITEQPELFVHITIPTEFTPIGKYNIGITAGVETDRIHHNWIEKCNSMDLVLVPSEFTKTILQNTFYTLEDAMGRKGPDLKIIKPIEVLFHGYDPEIYNSKCSDGVIKKRLDLYKEDFMFLFSGHWLPGPVGHDRKNVSNLILWFMNIFKDLDDAPALMLKVSKGRNSVIDMEETIKQITFLKRMVKFKKSLPKVYLMHGNLTDEEMNDLYNHPKIKAFVTITKGEGWGYATEHFSTTGKPIIATNYGGHLDHLRYFSKVDGILEEVDKSVCFGDVIIPGSKWYSAKYESFKDKMMDVWKNYKSHLHHAKKQQDFIKSFTLDEEFKLFKEIMDRYLPSFPVRVDLKLPSEVSS